MIAARVTETYASLFLTPKQDDGSRYSAIGRIGPFEVRMLELPSVNSPEELELWVELYDRDLRVGVDSYKCNDLDEAIDAAQFLTAQARQQSRGISAMLPRGPRRLNLRSNAKPSGSYPRLLGGFVFGGLIGSLR